MVANCLVIAMHFLKLYYTDIDKTEIESIGKFKIGKNFISFSDVAEAKANKKFNYLLDRAFKDLKNKVTKKPVVYVHQLSGIPLIGNNAFGLIDRNGNYFWFFKLFIFCLFKVIIICGYMRVMIT